MYSYLVEIDISLFKNINMFRVLTPNVAHLWDGRTCHFRSIIKFPQVKLNKKMVGSGPFRTHNKQAGKGIFTILWEWNMHRKLKNFAFYYNRVENKPVVTSGVSNNVQKIRRIYVTLNSHFIYYYYSLFLVLPGNS